MRLSPLVVLPFVWLLKTSSAWADAPTDAEVSRRLAFLENRLARGAASANLWWSSWYYGWTALTMGQFVWAIVTPDNGRRKDLAVGAASSTLGLLPLGVLPFPARTAWQDLSRVPATSPADRRRKLAFAEHLLKAAASDEKLRRSWVNHATSIGVSIAAGLVLGVGYDRPTSGVLNALGGIVLSEIQIWTQPTAAITDLADYQKLRQPSSTQVSLDEPHAPQAGFKVTVRPYLGGISISGSF